MPIRFRSLVLVPLAVATALLGTVRPAAAAFGAGSRGAPGVASLAAPSGLVGPAPAATAARP